MDVVDIQSDAVYGIVDSVTQKPPEELSLERNGDTLEVLVDDEVVARLNGFFAEGANATFSLDGSPIPTPKMAITSHDPMAVAGGDGDTIVWEVEGSGLSAGDATGGQDAWGPLGLGLGVLGLAGVVAVAAGGGDDDDGTGSTPDTTGPTVTAFSSTTVDGSYDVGDTVNVTATISEAIQSGDTITVTLDTGDEVLLTAASAGTSLTGSYFVGAGDNSADLTVTGFAIGAVTDDAGNAMTDTTVPLGNNLADNKDIVIDNTAPTVTAFSSTTNNGPYKEGDPINITATVSEAIQSGDTITVTLDTGDTVELTAASAGATLTGDYIVGTGDSSADLTVTGFAIGAVTDDAGNAMSDATLPAGNNIIDTSDIVIDTTAPTVTAFSSSTTDGAYREGDTINITATVSEAIQSGNTITVTLDTGDTVELTAASAGATLTGNYIVGTGDSSTDLTVASFTIGAVTDDAGNAMTDTAVPATSNIADTSDIVIDTTAPTVTAFTSSTPNGSYNSTSTINVTATVSEAIQSGNTITVTLDTGDTVELTAVSAGATLTGNYIVGTGDSSTDLTVASFTIGAVTDDVGNAMSNATLPAGNNIIDTSDIVIDTTAPTVTAFSSSTTDGAYREGDTINITATVSEAIQSGNTITVTLDTGDTVELTAALAGATLTGNYIVGAGDNSADLTVTGFAIGTVTDDAGNAMTGTTVPATSNIADTSDIVIDTTAPTVTAFSSTTTNGSYNSTSTINVTATVSEAIQSGNTITVTLDTGETATLTAASVGATTLTGTYDIGAGVNSNDLTVTGFAIGTVTDNAGNAMSDATLPAGNNIIDTSDIVIDTTAPTVTAFSSSTTDGGYKAGDTINITATVSEAIQSGDTITVTLDTGETATLTPDGASATTLTGTYDIGAGVNSSDLTVTGFTGTVTDDAGNAIDTMTLPTGNNIADNKDIVIDAIPPSITSVSVANGSHKVGDTVTITVTAGDSETGLTLSGTFNGQAVTIGAGQGDQGNGTYTATYTVAEGDADVADDGIVTTNLILTDSVGNDSSAHPSVTLSGESIDANTPTVDFSGASYAEGSNILTLTGTGMQTLWTTGANENAGTDIKARLDWTKLVWDINGDGDTTANVTFAEGDIASAVVIDDNTLRITFTTAKADTAVTGLENTTGYDPLDVNDKIQITEGFSTDVAGNAATTDAYQGPTSTNNVVFDLRDGQSSDHSGRVFDANTTYNIYIIVEADGLGHTDLDATGSPIAWDGAKHLGSDDTITLVSDGPMKTFVGGTATQWITDGNRFYYGTSNVQANVNPASKAIAMQGGKLDRMVQFDADQNLEFFQQITTSGAALPTGITQALDIQVAAANLAVQTTLRLIFSSQGVI